MIGGTTVDSQIARKMVLDIVNISVLKPELHACCFHSLEHIAFFRSFAKVEDLLKVKQESILQNWITSGNDFMSMPIGLCSPSLFQNIMQLGRIWDIMPIDIPTEGTSSRNHCEQKKILEVTTLHSDASREFISQTASLFVPIILFSHSESMEQVKCWEDLVQVANEIVNSSTDNDIESILRCHLHDIYAFIFPMLQINCCKSNTV